MAVTSDGQTLYVAAFGSSSIGVFNTAALEADTFDPRTASANYINVSAAAARAASCSMSRAIGCM